MQKTISTLCDKLGLTAMPVRFRHAASGQRLRRKGYDLVNNKGYIIASFEPVYSPGAKWYLSIKKIEIVVSGQIVTASNSEFVPLKTLRRAYKYVVHLEGMPVNDYITGFRRSDHTQSIEDIKTGTAFN